MEFIQTYNYLSSKVGAHPEGRSLDMSDPSVKSQKGIAATKAAVVGLIAKMRRRGKGGKKGRAVASDVR